MMVTVQVLVRLISLFLVFRLCKCCSKNIDEVNLLHVRVFYSNFRNHNIWMEWTRWRIVRINLSNFIDYNDDLHCS